MSDVIIPSNPEDRKAITSYLNNASDSLVRIGGERELIKEIIDDVSEKYEIPKKYIRQMIKIHHKANLNQVAKENEDLIDLYSSITGHSID